MLPDRLLLVHSRPQILGPIDAEREGQRRRMVKLHEQQRDAQHKLALVPRLRKHGPSQERSAVFTREDGSGYGSLGQFLQR